MPGYGCRDFAVFVSAVPPTYLIVFYFACFVLPTSFFCFFFISSQIPFSGRNPKFNNMVSRRPKILVLNKMDMADSSSLQVSKHSELKRYSES